MPENQTLWKSNNQGVKEETLTQNGRRGGGGQPGSEDSRLGGGWRTGWPHIRLQINREEQLGSESDCATQGSSSGK